MKRKKSQREKKHEKRTDAKTPIHRERHLIKK